MNLIHYTEILGGLRSAVNMMGNVANFQLRSNDVILFLPELVYLHQCLNTLLIYTGCISLLLPRLPKLPNPFEQFWLGNLSSAGSNKETQPWFAPDCLQDKVTTPHSSVLLKAKCNLRLCLFIVSVSKSDLEILLQHYLCYSQTTMSPHFAQLSVLSEVDQDVDKWGRSGCI